MVAAVGEELGRRDVERQRDVGAEREAGLADRLDDQVERLAVGRQVRGEAALVAEAGGEAAALQHGLQRVVDLGAPAQRLAKVGAPIGAIMNSWMSTLVSACAPPLRMFIIGTGSRWAFGPPT